MDMGTPVRKIRGTKKADDKDNMDLTPVSDSDFQEELERRRSNTKIIQVDGNLMAPGASVPHDDSTAVKLSDKRAAFKVEPDYSIDWGDDEQSSAVAFLQNRMGTFQWGRSTLAQGSIILASAISRDLRKKFTPGQVLAFLEANLTEEGNVKAFPKEKKLPDLNKAMKDPRFIPDTDVVDYSPLPEQQILIVSEDSVRCELYGGDFEKCKEAKCPHISLTLQQGVSGPLEDNSIFVAVCPVQEEQLEELCPKFEVPAPTEGTFKGKYKKMYDAFLEIMDPDMAVAAVQKAIEKEFSE